MRTMAFAVMMLATTMLSGTPAAMALDETAELEPKTIDCLKIDMKVNCVECGADPGIYCCIKGLHECTIQNPPPPPPPPPSRFTRFPTIRRTLGSSLYFTR